jgi:hypothetical protein
LQLGGDLSSTPNLDVDARIEQFLTELTNIIHE